jgi:hypothetical protein
LVRDRFTLAVVALGTGTLTTLAALAMRDPTPRSVDVVVLWLAGLLQLGLVLTWALIPRLPAWVVAGWGLILIALGIGVIIAAPVPAGAAAFPWALVGLVVIGIATIVAAIVHSSGEARAHF